MDSTQANKDNLPNEEQADKEWQAIRRRLDDVTRASDANREMLNNLIHQLEAFEIDTARLEEQMSSMQLLLDRKKGEDGPS